MSVPTSPLPTPGLRGIGYLGRDQRKLITELVADGVSVVVDVRLNAVSRKPGLSKRSLSHALDVAGIQYIHHAILGNPKANSEALSGGDATERIAAEKFYRNHIDNFGATATLYSIAELARVHKVALLCACLEGQWCHRRILLDILNADDR